MLRSKRYKFKIDGKEYFVDVDPVEWKDDNVIPRHKISVSVSGPCKRFPEYGGWLCGVVKIEEREKVTLLRTIKEILYASWWRLKQKYRKPKQNKVQQEPKNE